MIQHCITDMKCDAFVDITVVLAIIIDHANK